MPLSDDQIQIMTNVVSAFIGAGGSMGVQWLTKRKSSVEKSDAHAETMVRASTENIKATQDVISMLQTMLDKQEEHFMEQLERAKTSCIQQVESLKLDQETKMEFLKSDNDALNIRITNLIYENKELEIKMAGVTADNKMLQEIVNGLKKRLSIYEKYEKQNADSLTMEDENRGIIDEEEKSK